MGETLAAGGAVNDAVGARLGVRLAEAWRAECLLRSHPRPRGRGHDTGRGCADRAVADTNISALREFLGASSPTASPKANGRAWSRAGRPPEWPPGPVLHRLRRPRLRPRRRRGSIAAPAFPKPLPPRVGAVLSMPGSRAEVTLPCRESCLPYRCQSLSCRAWLMDLRAAPAVPKPSRTGFLPAASGGSSRPLRFTKPVRPGPPLPLRPCGSGRPVSPATVRHRGGTGPRATQKETRVNGHELSRNWGTRSFPHWVADVGLGHSACGVAGSGMA